MRLLAAIAQSIAKVKLQCRLVIVIIGFLYCRCQQLLVSWGPLMSHVLVILVIGVAFEGL